MAPADAGSRLRILTVYLVNTAAALSLDDDHLRSAALVSAGLELTAYELTSAAKPLRPPTGSFSFRLDHARVSVGFRSEAARIDLNQAPKEMLANFFQVLGARADDASGYADRIVGWRTPPSDDAPEAESSLYRAAGVDQMPRGAAFANVEELRLVLDLPPALVDRAMPFVTVFSGRREIDALEAAPEVVASLPGMTQDLLKAFLEQRATLHRDARTIASALGPAHAGATIEVGDSVGYEPSSHSTMAGRPRRRPSSCWTAAMIPTAFYPGATIPRQRRSAGNMERLSDDDFGQNSGRVRSVDWLRR